MVTEKETAIAKKYLEGKAIEGIWVNSNGELFSNEHLAKSSDKTAKFVENTTSKKEAEPETDKKANNTDLTKAVGDANKKATNTDKTVTDTNQVKTVTDADKKAENLKLLAETPLVKDNYKIMQTLVQAFDLKTADKRAETYIEALTQFKTTLNPV